LQIIDACGILIFAPGRSALTDVENLRFGQILGRRVKRNTANAWAISNESLMQRR